MPQFTRPGPKQSLFLCCYGLASPGHNKVCFGGRITPLDPVGHVSGRRGTQLTSDSCVQSFTGRTALSLLMATVLVNCLWLPMEVDEDWLSEVGSVR